MKKPLRQLVECYGESALVPRGQCVEVSLDEAGRQTLLEILPVERFIRKWRDQLGRQAPSRALWERTSWVGVAHDRGALLIPLNQDVVD